MTSNVEAIDALPNIKSLNEENGVGHDNEEDGDDAEEAEGDEEEEGDEGGADLPTKAGVKATAAPTAEDEHSGVAVGGDDEED